MMATFFLMRHYHLNGTYYFIYNQVLFLLKNKQDPSDEPRKYTFYEMIP